MMTALALSFEKAKYLAYRWYPRCISGTLLLLLLLLLLPSISNFQHHFSSTHHGSFSYDELLVNGSTSSTSSSSQKEILSRATDWPKENTTEEVKNREIQKRAFFLVVVVNLSCSLRFFCVFVFVMRRRR
jgi:hypothetical protein